MDVLNTIMQWIVAPIAGFVWLLHAKTQQNITDIAVIKAQTSATKEAHDREFKEVKESFKAVMEKLDNIEEHLRK
jgi:soluble cytochrome b562